MNWANKKLYAFAPFSIIASATETAGRRGNGTGDLATVADPSVVLKSSPLVSGTSYTNPSKPSSATTKPIPHISKDSKVGLDSNNIIRKSLQHQGLSSEVAQFLLKSWRASTKIQYGPHIQHWVSFCLSRKTDPLQPPLNLLGSLFREGHILESP